MFRTTGPSSVTSGHTVNIWTYRFQCKWFSGLFSHRQCVQPDHHWHRISLLILSALIGQRLSASMSAAEDPDQALPTLVER